jgi:hypothetical protein
VGTRDTFYPQKLALTSPTSGGHLVGIVCSQTKATEFFLGPDSALYGRMNCDSVIYWTTQHHILDGVTVMGFVTRHGSLIGNCIYCTLEICNNEL